MLLEVLLIFLVVWMLVSRWQRRHLFKLWEQLKNDVPALPVVGHAYLFLGSDEDRMKVFQKYGMKAYKTGGLYALWQCHKLYVNVSDPEIAELVLKNCLEKDDVLKVSRMLTGNGSVFAPVSIWRPRRKILAPTFSPKNLLQFAQIFSVQSEVMVNQLKCAVGKGPFSIWKYITSYSMDSVCESTLGVKVDAQRQPEQPFLKAFAEILKLDSARICQPWLHLDAVYRATPYYPRHVHCKTILWDFINKIIKNKRQTMIKEKDKQPESDQHSISHVRTFLELLMCGGHGFSDVELLEETLVLVLAGTDTSAVGTAFAALLLSRHQDVQEKVFQEIQEIFGDSDRPIVVADLPRLRYLDAVIRETLRLYPPVPVIVRKVEKDLSLPSGLVLVKDCGLLVNIWAIHRNPKYWGEDSMVFRPERWIDCPPKHPAAFMAFSYGPRGCIGYQYAMMSMKTAIASVLRRYKLRPAASLATDHNIPLRVKFDVMLKHVHDFELQLQPRLT